MGQIFVPPIELDRASKVPLHRQIRHQIARDIRNGAIDSNARLPSTRVMARLLHVSRNTVLVAYDNLAADGLVRGKRGAGVWVNGGAPANLTWFGLWHVIRASGYPARTLTLADPDGNSFYIRL
jgi:DNA-binding GntR family transcriptional regulator